MSRPKGSKNKVKSTFGKNYINVIQPTIDKDEQQSIEEHNATLNEQDATLDSFLLGVDATIASVELDYMPLKRKSIQKQLLSLMSAIHGEIAPHINSMRKGLTMGFCREEDKFIPDSTNPDYVKLIGIV
jgi:ribosomal protein L6P/L9E